MSQPAELNFGDYQHQFHADWSHLNDPHVRALAWLLTSPHLLNPASPVWHGANVAPVLSHSDAVHTFLTMLDQQPAALYAALAAAPTRRLGLYAETLFGFFLDKVTTLYAHGLQVQDLSGRTVGEFDFLVRESDALSHWELATKFYLLDSVCEGDQILQHPNKHLDLFDYLGPNLGDTLGAKMDKIVRQQLRLPHHPAATQVLDWPVRQSQAWIKGWLFYRNPAETRTDNLPEGIAAHHCAGYIWTLDDLKKNTVFQGVILPRLEWLAPVQCLPQQVSSQPALIDEIGRQMARIASPVMLAMTRTVNGRAQEVCRGMVLPEDWWARAALARPALKPGRKNVAGSDQM
ncbi:DUF1853 family protein [Undibacterium oligocarboniphilum]|uniref:DUF1853 family protein n=1 Tax=Undibacterium oligocarboniphilum TaxID=666702 RepID=A0A850QFE1_9BURK|nr:DUF1853 family protein [Undibacterium oligocarboniphilum]MBC3871226.1 DUF1853 family protein [Undibacterium oligocarboniphilum]NVO79202.1 DUF1853 family protein [Undibacterium oligocarboniphilum]